MSRAIQISVVLLLAIGPPAMAQTHVAYWTTYAIETAEPSDTKLVEEATASVATKWKLEYVKPRPESGVEAAYKKGHAGFEGVFYVTVDSKPDMITVEVAIDPRSVADHDKSHLLRADLERELSARFPGRLRSVTVSRSRTE